MTMTWHEESTPYTLEVLSTPPANLRDDTYKVRRYEMLTIITLPNADAKVWGRGAGKESWGVMAEDTVPSNKITIEILPTGRKIQYGMGGCEVVPGSRNGTSVALRTYIYKIEETKGNIMQGTWFPCPPQDVRYYYTVMNTTATVLAQLNDKSGASLNSQSPLDKPTINPERRIIPNAELFPIYPNPADNQVWVDVDIASSAAVMFDVTDILGKTVHHIPEQFLLDGSHTVGCSTTTLPNGNYTLRMTVKYANGSVEYKFRQFSILR